MSRAANTVEIAPATTTPAERRRTPPGAKFRDRSTDKKRELAAARIELSEDEERTSWTALTRSIGAMGLPEISGKHNFILDELAHDARPKSRFGRVGGVGPDNETHDYETPEFWA